MGYVRYITARRLERIGLARQYLAKKPFPWMSETIDLGKERNFFEPASPTTRKLHA